MTKIYFLPSSLHSEVQVFFTFLFYLKQNPFTHLHVFLKKILLKNSWLIMLCSFPFAYFSDDLALLSIFSAKIWLLLMSKMPWTEYLEALQSELGGQFLPHPFWPPLIMVVLKLMAKWVTLSFWPILSLPFTFRENFIHLPHLYEIFERLEACIF